MLMFAIKIDNLYLKDFDYIDKKSTGYPGHSQNLGIGSFEIFKPIFSKEIFSFTTRSIGEKIKTLSQCMKDKTMPIKNFEIITLEK